MTNDELRAASRKLAAHLGEAGREWVKANLMSNDVSMTELSAIAVWAYDRNAQDILAAHAIGMEIHTAEGVIPSAPAGERK